MSSANNKVIHQEKSLELERLAGQQCAVPSSLWGVVGGGKDGYCSLAFSGNGRSATFVLCKCYVMNNFF